MMGNERAQDAWGGRGMDRGSLRKRGQGIRRRGGMAAHNREFTDRGGEN